MPIYLWPLYIYIYYIYIYIYIIYIYYIYIFHGHFIGKLTKPLDLIGFTGPYLYVFADMIFLPGQVHASRIRVLPAVLWPASGASTAWDMGWICQRQKATHCYPEDTAYLC